MNERLIQNAQAYAARHQLALAEQLGDGVHGIVHVVQGNLDSRERPGRPGRSALKVLREIECFARERAVYERLRDARVEDVLGFHVPQLLHADRELLAVEMTLVKRPFVLDFAGAYLDAPPPFPDEIWAEWEARRREEFEQRWEVVQAILSRLEDIGIHMADVHPGNIAF